MDTPTNAPAGATTKHGASPIFEHRTRPLPVEGEPNRVQTPLTFVWGLA